MPRRNANARTPRAKRKPPKKLTTRQVALRKGYSSGFEFTEATRLKALGVTDSRYEAVTITWLDMQVRTYRPDFVLPNNIIVETKGRFTAIDRRKHKRIKEQHPELDIRFVFSNSNSKLYKGAKSSYGDWCDKNGFPFANETIPEEWLAEPDKPTVPKLIPLSEKEEKLVNEND
jgi:hypothetical protein